MLISIGSLPARSCAHGYLHQLVGPRTRWMVSRRGQHSACRAAAQRQPLTAEETLLDAFWHARGVWDQGQRAKLIACLGRSASSAAPQLHQQAPLPGVGAASRLDDPQGLAEVQHVSRQLVRLFQLLGCREDVDIVGMVQREPRLMWVSAEDLLQRLIQMKIAAQEEEVDVAKVAEAQPCLLLADHQISRGDVQSGTEQLEAWRHGLASDGDLEWLERFAQLKLYAMTKGDTHVGYWDRDDPDLGRWTAAQRTAHADGRLAADRVAALQEEGFEFSDEAAEWGRWYNELKEYRAIHDHCDLSSVTRGSAFPLINWCSVQRIAHRSRVLAPDRVEKLDALGFDWTGVDALS